MSVAKKSQEGSPLDSSEILKRKAAFDDYAHEEEGVEYWLAREIMKPLGYARWENFQEAIRRAAVSCEESKTPAQNHFRETTKTIPMPKGASRAISDFKLTRYACYLIAINGDPTKPEIALAQAYFAVMTRKQPSSRGSRQGMRCRSLKSSCRQSCSNATWTGPASRASSREATSPCLAATIRGR